MNKTLKIAFISAFALALSSCAVVRPYHPTGGLLYSNLKEDNITSVEATDFNATSYSKTGSSCAVNILGLVALGDATIEGAKNDSGIKKVVSVDYNYENILGFYGKTCVVVNGN